MSVPFGKARLVTEGGEVRAITYGGAIQLAEVAARIADELFEE